MNVVSDLIVDNTNGAKGTYDLSSESSDACAAVTRAQTKHQEVVPLKVTDGIN